MNKEKQNLFRQQREALKDCDIKKLNLVNLKIYTIRERERHARQEEIQKRKDERINCRIYERLERERIL